MTAVAKLKSAQDDVRLGQTLRAIGAIREVRQEFAPSAESEMEIGSIFESMGCVSQAIEAYRRSVELDLERSNRDSSNPEAYERLASLYQALQFHGRSAWYTAKAARLRRFDSGSLVALARTQHRLGKLESCLRTYRRALRLNPADSKVHSNYLFMLLHSGDLSAAELKEENERWLDLHGKTPPERVFPNEREPDRKLRIGYLSHEFHQSPDRHFLLPVIENHDQRDFEIYLFHTAPVSDAVTEEYKRCAKVWRDISALSLGEMSEQIRRDEIDVLVDRSGHISSCQSAAVLQQRSAPVQVAYSCYPCTTGCREVDYFVADRWTTSEAEFSLQFSERCLYQVPHGAWLYAPPPDLPKMSELPASQNGHVTFGVFQRPAKFNDGVWDAIAAVLGNVADSRLVIQRPDAELDEDGSRSRSDALDTLARRGIAKERITFVGARAGCEYFQALASVDIALDTFPYGGTTTTCGCLWMGVPVVTLAGERYSSRVSGSILSRMGLEEWVASSVEGYAAIARGKAADLATLAKLRSGLRERMAQSSVCRADIVVRELEEGYRWMWREWCGARFEATQQKETLCRAAAR
jgi:protein O-GlcNAc transferase